MYDQHKALNKFYDENVRLGKDRRDMLAGYRDKGLKRLRDGLDILEYPHFRDWQNQGSYAMHTLNQHPDNNYDIDVAIIFGKEDLPSTPLAARKRVEAALIAAGGGFSTPPEAKTNAVRIYYEDGHHIDFAIYRVYTDAYGDEVIEHAGSEWLRRVPSEITIWFTEAVKAQSPSGYFAEVEANQLRRVVRLLKAFAKSCPEWNLPGGLIISALAVENYRPDGKRDDCALYNTMSAIYNRVLNNTTVYNPVDPELLLTHKYAHVQRVENFRDKLGEAIKILEPLHSPECTPQQAATAWGSIFQHDFWKRLAEIEEQGVSNAAAVTAGTISVSPLGHVTSTKPSGNSVQPPPHRFYGDK